MKEHLIASILTGLCIIVLGVTVILNKAQKMSEKKKSTLVHARLEASYSTIGAVPTDKIIKGWKLSEKMQNESKMNFKTSSNGEIMIKEKGVYIINSLIHFWGRCQYHAYELMKSDNNTSIRIKNCTCNSAPDNPDNPDIVPCLIKTEVNVRNKEKIYFKVNSDSMIVLTANHCYINITKTA